jgi:fluoride exporter
VGSTDAEQVVDGKGRLPTDPDLDLEAAQSAPGHRPHRRRRLLAAIAVGGFAGGLARYGIGLAFPTPRGAFPAATFAINVSGSFVLALLVVFVLEIWPPTTYVRPLLGTGFCGAFTTFSTWMVDTDRLLSGRQVGTAAWYLFGSLAAGLAATSLGLSVGRAVVVHRRHRRGALGRRIAEGGES